MASAAVVLGVFSLSADLHFLIYKPQTVLNATTVQCFVAGGVNRLEPEYQVPTLCALLSNTIGGRGGKYIFKADVKAYLIATEY